MRKLFVGAAILAGAAAIAAAAGAKDDPRRKRGELEVVSRTPVEAPGDALFAAAELARAGGAFYEGLFARGFASDAAMRAATIDGAEREAIAAAERHILRGGAAGLPLQGSAWARAELLRLQKAGGAQGIGGGRDLVDGRLRSFARAAGLVQPPPSETAPSYAEAWKRPASADGKRPAAVVIDSSGLAFGLVAEVRLAARLAGQRRGGPSGGGGPELIGETPERGYEGLALLACAAAKLHALRTIFAFDGEALKEASALADYDPYAAPRYLPRTFVLREGGEAPDPTLAVEDPASRLGDAAAVVIGAAELARLADAQRSPETASLFGMLNAGGVREELFAPQLAQQAKEMVRLFFRNIAALHFEPGAKRPAFVAEALPAEKRPRVVTADAALAMLAIEAALETFPEDQRLAAEGKKLLTSQAQFFVERLGPDGALPGAFDLEAKPKAPPEPADLAGEALAVEALLATARVTGEEKWKETAAALARSLERRRWDPWVGLYLGDVGGSGTGTEFTLSPRDGPAVLGAMRELHLALGAADALDRFREAHAALAKAGALPRPEDGECAAVKVRVKR